MKFQVQTAPTAAFQEVEAAYTVTDYGCLLFFNGDNQVILALAPGQWLTVHQEEAGKAAQLRSIRE